MESSIEQRQTTKSEYLIEQVIFYGILKPEKLSVEELKTTTPKVGVLNHFQKGVEVQIQGIDEEFEMWAYPDGIKIYDHTLTVINDEEPENSFGECSYLDIIAGNKCKEPPNYTYSFVHTDYSLNRKYYSALCWHQKKYIRVKDSNDPLQERSIYEYSLPKCTLWQLQNDPQLVNLNQTLVYLPKVLIIGSSRPVFTFQRQMLLFYYRNVIAETTDPVVRTSTLEYFKDLVYVAGYPRAEIEFDKGTELTARTLCTTVNKKNLELFYTSCFFLPKISQKSGIIQVIDCPNSSVKFTPVQITLGQCFTGPNIDLLGILKKVGIKNLVGLWKCMLLERHIIVFSMNSSTTIDLFETLLYLLQPIRWENIYIPFLPFHLINNIEAIQSYLIGISKIHMNYVIDHYKHQMKDIVIYDLDDNLLIQNTTNPIELPQPISYLLTERLRTLGFDKERSFLSFFRDSQQKMTDLQKIINVKRIFFDSLIYLLNNYRPFASLKDQNLLNFDRQGYSSIFKDVQWARFSEHLVETMIFTRLCEYHLYEQKILKWNQSNFGGLFVYCQNVIAENNPNKSFWQIPAYKKGSLDWQLVPYNQYFCYVLQESTAKLRRRRKNYQIEKYLVKYIGWMKMHEQGGHFLIEKESNKSSNSFFRGILQFLLPWLKEVQIRQTASFFHMDRSRYIQLLNLQCLFQDKSKGTQLETVNSNEIMNELKSYRQHKNRFLTLGTIKRKNREQKRINERMSV